jgi:hypothetical protein
MDDAVVHGASKIVVEHPTSPPAYVTGFESGARRERRGSNSRLFSFAI